MTSPKITVGNVEIMALVDMPFELPWAMIFPGRDQAEVEPYQKKYPPLERQGRLPDSGRRVRDPFAGQNDRL